MVDHKHLQGVHVTQLSPCSLVLILRGPNPNPNPDSNNSLGWSNLNRNMIWYDGHGCMIDMDIEWISSWIYYIWIWYDEYVIIWDRK